THLTQSPDGLSELPESGCLHGEWGIGITIGTIDEESDDLAPAPDTWARYLHVTNLLIQGNNIVTPLSNGIFLNSDVQVATIIGNNIRDPGSSPFNPYGTVPCYPDPARLQYMHPKYTAALRVGGGENVTCIGPLCPNPPPPAVPAASNVQVPGIGHTPNMF